MIFLRKLHKWLGLLIGLQVLVWVVSGALISLIDAQTVGGGITRKNPSTPPPLSSLGSLVEVSQLQLVRETPLAVTLDSLESKAIYRVTTPNSTRLFDATTGLELFIDKTMARRIALASYAGTGQLLATRWIAGGADEVRGTSGAVWRADFSDDLSTRVYVSAEDGKVLAHRNNRWQLVDFLLMLHFMDYFDEGNFNNPQVIGFAFATLWLTLSGILLVVNSFSRRDFLWLPGNLFRGDEVQLTAGPTGEQKRNLSLDSSLSVYAALFEKAIVLPSNCDGSGSCGLCRITYEANPPLPSGVDQHWISPAGLAAGERLACQHKPRSSDSLLLPALAGETALQEGAVVSSQWLTPLLKEIVVRPDKPVDFKPGEYFQFRIPPGEIYRGGLNIPAKFIPDWETMKLPDQWHNQTTIFRAYSLACPPAVDNTLVFTVRFAPPPAGSGFPPGLGSSYMCSLTSGTRVSFRGPGGGFTLRDSNREKIFIGGGAGMAPLKSMVLHLLENTGWQGKLRYWYGARDQGEIIYRDTFETLAKQHPNFEWRVALSEADTDENWRGPRGFIHECIFELLLKNHPALSNCEFYLCGPPPMLTATRNMLSALGVSSERVLFDDFGN